MRSIEQSGDASAGVVLTGGDHGGVGDVFVADVLRDITSGGGLSGRNARSVKREAVGEVEEAGHHVVLSFDEDIIQWPYVMAMDIRG